MVNTRNGGLELKQIFIKTKENKMKKIIKES
jgi:hypothetical protein